MESEAPNAAVETKASITPRLELPKTRVQLVGEELIRLGKESGTTMRIPLDDVKSVQLNRRLDMSMLLFLLFAAGLVTIPRFVSTYSLVEIGLYVAALLCLLIALFGLIGQRIVFDLGERKLEMPMEDDHDVGDGFVVSLQTIIRRRNGTWKQ